MQTISILGCGWVGMTLATHLQQRKFTVKGSTTTSEKIALLEQQHIQAFLIDLSHNHWEQNFFECDCLVIAIPPSKNTSLYTDTVEKTLKTVSNTTKIILLSSTSVYKSTSDIVDESSETKSLDDKICLAESIVKRSGHPYSIVRLGGLMGYDRTLLKYFAKRETVNNRPVNYIHRDDVIQFLTLLIENKRCNKSVYNLVAPEHPTTKEIYQTIAPKDSQRILWQDDSNKCVISKNIPDDFNYKYPDPIDMFRP